MTTRGAVGRGLRALVGLLPALVLLGCAGPAAEPGPPPPVAAAPTTAAAPTGPATPSPATPSSPRPTPPPEPAVSVPTVDAELRPSRSAPKPPRSFLAGTVGIDLPVVPVGVAEDGTMGLPETVHEVAWYRFGSRPGDDAGTTVLAAHVDTVAEGLGPFARLRELDEGDELTVVDGRGREHRYRVTDVEQVVRAEVPLDQVFRRDGPPALVVLTCGGSFDRDDGYSSNVVVTAEPR